MAPSGHCFRYGAYAYFRLLKVPFHRQEQSKVRIHLGSKEVLARIILLDKQEIKPGEEAL